MRPPSQGLIGLAMLATGMAMGRYTAPVGRDASGTDAGPIVDVAGEPAPRSLEAAVYLPLSDNRGRPFPEEEWSAALEILVARFGGATLGEPREGCWLDARRRIRREPVRPVVVSFAPRRLEEFRRAILDVGQRLDQEAMYVRFEEPRVELIPVAAARLGGGRGGVPRRGAHAPILTRG